MSDANKGLYNKYQIIHRDTGEEVDGSYFVLNPVKDHVARKALEEYAKSTSNDNLRSDLLAWMETMPDLQCCDWCGEVAEEFSGPHLYDWVPDKKMCRKCWDHDRQVYKGSYGDDIGEFRPVGQEGKVRTNEGSNHHPTLGNTDCLGF